MDDHSLMYRDPPEKLRRMDYCNEIEGFINYTLSNPRNINGDGIRCSCKRCKNKKFLDTDVVTMHLLQKKVFGELLMLVCTRRTICSSRDQGRNDDWSTSNSSSIHEVLDDKNNPYRDIVIDAMRINQSYVGQCPIINEEPNADTIRFNDLLKDYEELL